MKYINLLLSSDGRVLTASARPPNCGEAKIAFDARRGETENGK
jgi:hypothetical protein